MTRGRPRTRARKMIQRKYPSTVLTGVLQYLLKRDRSPHYIPQTSIFCLLHWTEQIGTARVKDLLVEGTELKVSWALAQAQETPRLRARRQLWLQEKRRKKLTRGRPRTRARKVIPRKQLQKTPGQRQRRRRRQLSGRTCSRTAATTVSRWKSLETPPTMPTKATGTGAVRLATRAQRPPQKERMPRQSQVRRCEVASTRILHHWAVLLTHAPLHTNRTCCRRVLLTPDDLLHG